MILTVKLNNDDNKVYRLVSWNAQGFGSLLTLLVQGNDLSAVKNDFEDITKIEIFQDEMLVATYTNIDSYDEITFLKNEYVPGEQKFTDAMRIHLTKTNIIEQINRIDEQINPVIDIESMTLAEAKEYKIKELGDICRAEIYAGEDVELSDGTVKAYTYNADDQANVLSAITLAFAAKEMGFDLDYIPYHANGSECELLDTPSMVAIYMTLQLRLTRLTTKCNMLNCMIRDCNSKEDVLAISWNTQLTQAYQQRYDEIVTVSVEIAQAMAQAMMPPQEEIEPEEPEQNEEE